MPLISIHRQGHEIYQYRPPGRLRRADLRADGGGVARRDRTAGGGGPFRSDALRLASGSVPFLSLHDRAFDDRASPRAELTMPNVEAKLKNDAVERDRAVIRPREELAPHAARRRLAIIPILITAAVFLVAVASG